MNPLSLLAPLLAPLARLAGYLATFAAGWGIARREQRHAQEMADAKAQLDMAESRERVRDPGVVSELRRRHTRPD